MSRVFIGLSTIAQEGLITFSSLFKLDSELNFHKYYLYSLFLVSNCAKNAVRHFCLDTTLACRKRNLSGFDLSHSSKNWLVYDYVF